MPTTVTAPPPPRTGSAEAMRTLYYRDYRLRYVDRGSGDPIMFVHNGGLSHRLWDHQLAEFEGSHRVIAPDLLGWGESDRPDIRYSAEDYVAQVAALADHLQLDSFHLVGSCLGGGIVLDFARRHPNRVCSVTAIGPVTPRTIASGPFGLFERISSPGSWLRGLMWRFCETGPGRWFASRLLFRLQRGEQAVAEDPSFRRHVKRLQGTEGQWRVLANTDYSGFAAVDHVGDGARALPPTLLMWGRENRVLRASAGEELADALDPERAEFWDGCGYFLMRERPGDTNRVLREFIAAHEVAPRTL
jgi:pimeloyl-ACP methyl ester carboxylesterase